MSTFYTGIQVFRAQRYSGTGGQFQNVTLYTVPSNRWAEVTFSWVRAGTGAWLAVNAQSSAPDALNTQSGQEAWGDHSKKLRLGPGESVVFYAGSAYQGQYDFSVVEFG